MLYYDRIDVSVEIHVNKTNESRDFIICNYYEFLKILDFSQKYAMVVIIMHKVMSFNDVADVSVKRNDYRTDF